MHCLQEVRLSAHQNSFLKTAIGPEDAEREKLLTMKQHPLGRLFGLALAVLAAAGRSACQHEMVVLYIDAGRDSNSCLVCFMLDVSSEMPCTLCRAPAQS